MTDNATSANPGLPVANDATEPVDHGRRQATGELRREHFVYDLKGGSLRSPPAPQGAPAVT
jgi:hypothetical protein